MTPGERAGAAACRAVGARFRLHGRDPATGLDCVGVALLALRAGGHAGPSPEGYPLRTGDVARYAACWDGLAAADGAVPGDVIVMRTATGQVHLAVRTVAGFVHADIALRRVVERPGSPPWPVIAAWRLHGDGLGG